MVVLRRCAFHEGPLPIYIFRFVKMENRASFQEVRKEALSEGVLFFVCFSFLNSLP